MSLISGLVIWRESTLLQKNPEMSHEKKKLKLNDRNIVFHKHVSIIPNSTSTSLPPPSGEDVPGRTPGNNRLLCLILR